MMEFYLFLTPFLASSTKKLFKIIKKNVKKKKSKNAIAGRPLVTSHILSAFKVRPNVAYETSCCKKGHCPKQLSLQTATHAKLPILLFLMADSKRYPSNNHCQ